MCEHNLICSLPHPARSDGFLFYVHSVSTRVVLFVLRWLRGWKLQGDGEVGSLLLFQFGLCCYELINLCGGHREAAAQPDWIVFSRLCLNFAWCPSSWAEPPVTVHNGAEFEFAKKIPLPPRLPHREPSLLCVLQGMSLVIPSGWISPGRGTTRVTTMHGASLTCWTWNTSATTSSTPSTGTWTERRTSTAGWLPHP